MNENQFRIFLQELTALRKAVQDLVKVANYIEQQDHHGK